MWAPALALVDARWLRQNGVKFHPIHSRIVGDLLLVRAHRLPLVLVGGRPLLRGGSLLEPLHQDVLDADLGGNSLVVAIFVPDDVRVPQFVMLSLWFVLEVLLSEGPVPEIVSPLWRTLPKRLLPHVPDVHILAL